MSIKNIPFQDRDLNRIKTKTIFKLKVVRNFEYIVVFEFKLKIKWILTQMPCHNGYTQRGGGGKGGTMVAM